MYLSKNNLTQSKEEPVSGLEYIKGATLNERALMVLATLGRSPEEIKQAFRRLAKQHHPDISGGDTLRFKLVNEAYQFLTEGYVPSQPLLADDQLVSEVAGRQAAPLLDLQKAWDEYHQWHDKQFHGGDWFYPNSKEVKSSRKKEKRRSRR